MLKQIIKFKFESSSELKLLRLANDSKADREFTQLVVNEYSFEMLFKLCEKNPTLESHLQRASLNDYWLTQLKVLGKWKGHAYRPQASVSPFQQVKGLFLFYGALKKREATTAKNDTEITKMLIEADKLGCYHASREIQFANIEKLLAQTDHLPIDEFKKHADSVANLHMTPGHIFAAEYYIYIANYFHASKTNKEEKNAALMKAVYHLTLAKELEHHSKNSIHNAFFGTELAQALNEGSVTVTKLTEAGKSYAQFADNLIAKLGLDEFYTESAKKLALQTMAEIQKNFYELAKIPLAPMALA